MLDLIHPGIACVSCFLLGVRKPTDQIAHGLLVRAHCSRFYPCFGERARCLLGAGSRLPAVPGRPSPTDQMVLADMLNERFERTVSIARRILDLGTDLTERLAFPSHFTRGEMPDRVPGTPAGSKFACWWQIGQRIAGSPNPSAPRSTGGWWSRATSP